MGGALAALARGGTPPTDLPAFVSIERDGFRYEYDALTGRESLFDVSPSAEDRDLFTARRADASRLRHLLERQLNLRTLEDLRAMHQTTAESLHSLGYL